MTANNNEPDNNMNQDNDTDTSFIDEQWQELAKDWQQQPTEKADIKKLLKETKRRTRKAKCLFWGNVVATIGLLFGAMYGTLIEDSWERSFLSYMWGSFVLSVVFCYYEYKIRQTAWQQINDSPENAVNNAIKGIESSLSYIRLTKWSCLPFGLLANFFVYETALNAEKPAMNGLITINILIVLMFAITHWFGLKRQKELKAMIAKTKNN
ncbi:hypothetical protein Q4489_04855 [Thalassotalea sp. 1_MG-2023]|uniref:hypothetical protein n=1 Tax=Thalassotalea sp. 1_MG-2023 TaxID=3062680 RepID=UPI0026E30990|nr:hypothetical protein [Thalassotalea sp. 1_MG-2023]MDO6426329.1 hypothetical protein [Thalassotalea sp. 1_MG-2023]